MEENKEEIIENNVEKTKIKKPHIVVKALVISLVISIILSIIISIVIINSESCSGGHSDADYLQIRVQNTQFTSYFGDKVSASDVKALISLIRSNNIATEKETGEEIKIIAIKFQDSTGTAEILIPSLASKKIIAGRTYFVGTDNENMNKEDEDPTIKGAKDTNSAYYKSGYLRIITIKENTSNQANSNQNNTNQNNTNQNNINQNSVNENNVNENNINQNSIYENNIYGNNIYQSRMEQYGIFQNNI